MSKQKDHVVANNLLNYSTKGLWRSLMKLVIALGNPGKKYDKTRHNIGFTILNGFVQVEKWSSNEYADYLKITLDGEKAILIKPTTYMNLSGTAVSYFAKYYKAEIKDILVIHDDLDIETGNFKLKTSSSSAGHNGIESIINTLKTKDFLRLKIGISRPTIETADYVLDKFSKADLNKIIDKQPIFNNIISDFIKGESAEGLMNKYNGLS